MKTKKTLSSGFLPETLTKKPLLSLQQAKACRGGNDDLLKSRGGGAGSKLPPNS